MAANKAVALKDAYIKGIAEELGAEVMAEASAMENAKPAGKLGLDVGDQASMIYDSGRGVMTSINDGNPTVSFIDQGKGLIYENSRGHSSSAMPINNGDIDDERFLGIFGGNDGIFGAHNSFDDAAPGGIYMERGFRDKDPQSTDRLLRGGRRLTNADINRLDVRRNPGLTKREPHESALQRGEYTRVP